MWANWRSLLQFRASSRDVRHVQHLKLLKTIRANRDTMYGRQFGFDQVRNVNDFRENVPLADYDHFRPWIDQICAGVNRVLTADPVRLFEPTSGTTHGRKLIP